MGANPAPSREKSYDAPGERATTGEVSSFRDLPPGTRVESYEVVSTLGRGGMGVVYKAREVLSGREVALKLVLGARADDQAFMKRFEREARVAAALRHDNVVSVLTSGRHAEQPYLVLELME